eukprot:g16885.t1
MDRLMPDPAGDGVPSADLIIEAISEKLEAKQGLFAALEPRMKEGALLASNTSSIPLEDLSANLAKPDRLVGIHFFNPVALMQLVEVVRGENSSDASVAEALAFVNAIGKLPIEVKSAPGFLVNRVLMTYLSEAMKLYEEGVPPEAIDKAAVDFGMPMGPIELADTVGLDICQAVATELIEAFGGKDTGLLSNMLEEKKLGKKSGEGFYKWEKGAMANGAAMAGAIAMGADFAYMGTRFIATTEANAQPEYKQMLVDCAAKDIVYSSLFTGVSGNYLKPSIANAGLDPDNLPEADKSTMNFEDLSEGKKAWKDIWGAGQGLGSIDEVVLGKFCVQQVSPFALNKTKKFICQDGPSL